MHFELIPDFYTHSWPLRRCNSRLKGIMIALKMIQKSVLSDCVARVEQNE